MVPVVRGLLNNLAELRQFREQKVPTRIALAHQSGQRCLLYQKSGHSRRSCFCSLLSSYCIPTSANRALTFAGSSQIVGFVTGHCRRCIKSKKLVPPGPPITPQSATTSRPPAFFTRKSIVSPLWPPISL